MGGYVTVSAKISKELKEKIDKYGIRVGEVVRRALELEVKRRILEEAGEKYKLVKDALKRIPGEEIVKTIREDREAR